LMGFWSFIVAGESESVSSRLVRVFQISFLMQFGFFQ
jgi:hypothetical protein